MDGILNLFLLEHLNRAEERFRQNVQRRILRDASNPFELPDSKFIKLFRLQKDQTRHFIEEIRPSLQISQRSTAIATELKVFTTLLFLSQGSYQTCAGDNFNLGLSQKSISNCISEITDAVTENLLNRYVVFPQSEETRTLKKIGFMQKFNFPGVFGAIDCTHIAIKAPPTNDDIHPGIAYYNRKGFYSVNVQLICDSDLNILNCNARFPGSCHDSGIWELSSVRQHLQQQYFLHNLQSSWLIGDSGYGLQPWLLTPIIDAEEHTPEGRYTKTHILARNCIERCIGLLKQRFRCLLHHRVLHYDPIRAGKIIYTCAVLHNIINKERILNDLGILHQDYEEIQEPVVDEQGDFLNQGRDVRRALIEQHFQ